MRSNVLFFLLIPYLGISCNFNNQKVGSALIKTEDSKSSESCKYNNKVLIATSAGINVTDSNFSDFSHTITKAEGLPNNTVRHLHFDNDSLYAATPEGLVIFKNDCSLLVDQVITTSQGLPSNNVSRIYTAPDKSLWVATAGGIARSFDGGRTFSAYITPSTPGMSGTNFDPGDHNYGNVIAFGGVNNNLVLIGFSNLVCRSVDNGLNFTCLQPSTIVNHWYADTVTGIVKMNNGYFVMATGRGIFISQNEGVTWSPGTGLSNLWCNGLDYDAKSEILYVSTGGFSSYSTSGDGSGFTHYGTGSSGIWNTFSLPSGKIAMATVGAGLFLAQNQSSITTTSAITTTSGLLSNRIFWVSFLE